MGIDVMFDQLRLVKINILYIAGFLQIYLRQPVWTPIAKHSYTHFAKVHNVAG
jgi:hypothetical protein